MDVKGIQDWFVARRSWCMSLLRMYLGVGLLVKGLTFAFAPDALATLIDAHGVPVRAVFLAHYVILAHVLGGTLLALGVATRLAALIQVPVLFGAVFFVHWGGGALGTAEELKFSALVLVLLLLFVWYGPGPLSLDAWRRKRAGMDESSAA